MSFSSSFRLILIFPFKNKCMCVLVWFCIWTIILAFRRARVCVCLVGFASLQSSWAYTHKASLPLYERSVGFASLQSHWAFISGILALLASPVAPNFWFPKPTQKNNYPLPKMHSRLLICNTICSFVPSLNPDRSAILRKSATLSKVGIYCSFQLQLFG